MVRWKHTWLAVATVAALTVPLAQATDISTDTSTLDEEVFYVENWVLEEIANLDADTATATTSLPADCPDQRDGGAVSMLDKYYVRQGKEYDGTITLSLYGEKNGLPGLQTWWTVCDPDEAPLPPDNKMTGVNTDRRVIW